jgi:hypothetical protein
MREERIKCSNRLNRASKISTESLILVIIRKGKNLFLGPTQGGRLNTSTLLSGGVTRFPDLPFTLCDLGQRSLS